MKNSKQSSVLSTVSAAERRYRATQFFDSVNALEQLPLDSQCEVAFAGRSNAGKSSALNLLTGQRQLARVSKTPGRTQMINFFHVETGRYLVDLPGYGYAQAPEAVRRHWSMLLERYMREREALVGLLLLMDMRHPLTALDQQMLDYCAARGLAVHILLTKADKLSRGAAANAVQKTRSFLSAHYPYASIQAFSASTGQGLAEVQQCLDAWLGFAPAAVAAAPSV